MKLLCVVENCGDAASTTSPFFPLCSKHAILLSAFQHEAEALPREEFVLSLASTFSDARGEIINILNAPINHAAIITSKKGSIRANHWHPAPNIQFMYLISGSYEAHARPVSLGLLDPNVTERVQIVRAGQIAICPPFLAHAYRFLADSVFINLNLNQRHANGYGEHTFPIKLLSE